MTETEVEVLQERVRESESSGGVWWTDGANMCVRVLRVDQWFKPAVGPEIRQPTAILEHGRRELGHVVILKYAELSSFVHLRHSTTALPSSNTSYVDRVIEALKTLCAGKEPDRDLVVSWLDCSSEKLQDWAANNVTVAWATGVGTLDAALTLAKDPAEGQNHQSVQDAFVLDWKPSGVIPPQDLPPSSRNLR